MGHALKRISYATCDPQRQCFSFLARQPRDPLSAQYCHTFLTATPQQVSLQYCHTFLTATPQQVITATRSSQPHHSRSLLPHVPHSHTRTAQYCHTFLTATQQQVSTATRSSQPHHSSSVLTHHSRSLLPHVPHSHTTTARYCHTFLTATPQQVSLQYCHACPTANTCLISYYILYRLICYCICYVAHFIKRNQFIIH